MDKEVKIAAFSFVTLLAVIVLMHPLIFTTDNFAFSELAVLGPDKNLSGYPGQLAPGQPFLLYGYIGNHEGAPEYYQFVVKLGNESTQISNTTAANAPVILSDSVVLLNNQSSTFPMLLSLGNLGDNQRLIFELWTYDVQQSSFKYTGVWNEIWVNVTV